jgi:hypothetical protein
MFLRCRRSVFHLTHCNIDDELGEFGGIAGTFAVISQDQYRALDEISIG